MDERTLWLQFQFHKGTIKPWTDGRSFGLGRNFNSIKVRLNRKNPTKRTAYSQFQFHKGTIKPVECLRDIETLTDFNSIKVRLNPRS